MVPLLDKDSQITPTHLAIFIYNNIYFLYYCLMRFLAYTHANPLIQGSGGEKYLQGLLEKLVEKGDDAFCLCSNENKKWKLKTPKP